MSSAVGILNLGVFSKKLPENLPAETFYVVDRAIVPGQQEGGGHGHKLMVCGRRVEATAHAARAGERAWTSRCVGKGTALQKPYFLLLRSPEGSIEWPALAAEKITYCGVLAEGFLSALQGFRGIRFLAVPS
jgi:hypothetical protein